MDKNQIAEYIDHTYLKAEGTSKVINKLIDEAKEYSFKSVCVNPCWVKHAKDKLKDSKVLVTTVVGFPLGANSTQAKVYETKLSLDHGVDEIDMVINIGKFKEFQDDYVLNEIKKIKETCREKILKVIVETALLNNAEIERITKIVLQSGADFIKTSTGFSYTGAKVEDVQLMNKIIQNKIGIKASGGIKNYDDFIKMVKAGATRIGTSNGIAIISGDKNESPKDY